MAGYGEGWGVHRAGEYPHQGPAAGARHPYRPRAVQGSSGDCPPKPGRLHSGPECNERTSRSGEHKRVGLRWLIVVLAMVI